MAKGSILNNKIKEGQGYNKTVKYWAQIIRRIHKGTLKSVDKANSIFEHLLKPMYS